MARGINLAFVLLLIFFVGCDTASNVEPLFKTTFIRYFGTTGDQYAADLLLDESEGNFLVLANSVSLAGEKTAFVIKTDIEGNVLAQRRIGDPAEIAVDVESVSNGGDVKYVIAMNHFASAQTQIKLLRLRADLSPKDSILIPLHNGGFRQEVRGITALKQTDEYIVAGLADGKLVKETSPVDETNDQSDILAFRLSNSMQILDTVVTKGGEKNGCGIRAFELEGTNQGKVVLFSYTDRPFTTDEFGYNFSFDIVTSGTPVGKLIGNESDQEFMAAAVQVPFANGAGYLMAGTVRSSISGPGEIYLVKYDDEFQQRSLDARISIDKNLECVAASNAQEGFLVLANEQTTASKDILLVKVNRFGEFEWMKSFGTPTGDDSAAAIVNLSDGRIAVAATIELQTRRKVALIVLKSDGNF